MSKVAIVTDSNSGIRQEEGKKLGIYVLPMPFTIDGETFYEDINLTHSEFFDKLMSGAEVFTSQPLVGDVSKLWDDVLKEYDEIVYIPMSSGLSGNAFAVLPCPASVVAVNDLCIRRALIIDRHDQPPRISAVLYLQPAPGTEDIIPGAFPLYHAGNDFVRMPAGAAVIAVKLHDIAGVVHLQLRVLVEYLHRYFHRPCALVFGVLGHGQQRSVPAKLILFCKAVRRQPAQR